MKRKNPNTRARFSRNCNNSVLDIAIIVIAVLIMAIGSIFGYMALTDVNADIQADSDMTAEAKNVTGNLYTIYPSLMDNLFLFAFVLFIVFVLISVFLIDTHPVFFVIAFILLISVFIVGIFLANAYDDIASDNTVSQYANSFPYTSWVTNHLVELIIAVGLMIGLAMFLKFR